MLRRSLGGLVLALMVIALSLMSSTPALAGPPGDSVVAVAQVAAPDSAIAIDSLALVAPATQLAIAPIPNVSPSFHAAAARPAPSPVDSLVPALAPVLGAGGARRSPVHRETLTAYPTSQPATLAADSLTARRWHLGSFTALALLTVAARR